MRQNPRKRTCSIWTGLVVLTVLIMTMYIVPVWAQQRPIRIGPQAAEGGLTIAEQAARSVILYNELIRILPPGIETALLHIGINQKDRDELSLIPPSGTAPLRVGIIKSVTGSVGKAPRQSFNYGITQQNPGGGFEWAMTITSSGAQAIRVHFTDFSLPDNTKMYFLGSNGQAHGPYVGKGRNNTGEFWTRSIASDTGTILLNYSGYTPDIDQPKISFTISDIGHIRGRPPLSQEKNLDTWPCSDNADCLVDVNCMNDTGPALPAENAVAKMEWIESPYIYTCTGGLLADTDDSTQIPYFLTANHCLTESNNNLETFFNYTTDGCDGGCPDGRLTDPYPPPTASTVGATVVATGDKGDFTLLILNEEPPAGTTFLGWNNAPVATTNEAPLYRISNPNFGPQVYSQHNVDVTSQILCVDWPRGERIYSKDIIGTTMGGSSGSPVLNSEGEVVGQLSGCCGYECDDVCNSDSNRTVDGALAYYWDSVAGFLDPSPCSDTDTDGDGTLDCDDNCPTDPNKTDPGQCGCGVADKDLDVDGTADCNDGCLDDPAKIEPGICGCGTPDTDTDNDGTADCNDGCPGDPDKAEPGVCGCGVAEDECQSDCTACFKGKCDGVCHPKEGTDCPDCSTSSTETNCSDGIDNDSDGLTDCYDQDCSDYDGCQSSNEICGNGIDDDGDGYVDCKDPDCKNDPSCVSPQCLDTGESCTSKDECCSNKCVRNKCK